MKKNILVAGATGFLGSGIVRQLLNKGYNVLILKREQSDTKRIDDLLPHLIVYDIKNVYDLPQVFQKSDQIHTVINTVALYEKKNQNFIDIFNTNTVFSMNLLENCIKYNIAKYINVDTSLHPLVNFYALSKKQFTEWGKRLAKMQSIHFINVKPEIMFGPGDNVYKFPSYIINQFLQNVEYLNLSLGEQMRDFIYIEDVISAFFFLLEKDQESNIFFEEYELGNSRPISIHDFVKLVKQKTGATTILKFGAIPYRANEVMYSNANVEPLLKLGWQPIVSLEKGIDMTINWYRQQI